MQLALFDLRPYTQPRPTKQERLQSMWDASGRLLVGEVVFRGVSGWWIEPTGLRHFNDEGEYLGRNFDEAASRIKWLIGG